MTVVLLIFNRPDRTQAVFEAISRARPDRLLVVADGARASMKGEEDKCAAARAVTEHVDWECIVERNYSAINLGCGRRVSSGLTWAFDRVDEALVLEDDCLPAAAFFPYCDELLARYRNDTRVMHINGSNFNPEYSRNGDSYFFSHHAHVWGWATWRRAWREYDYDMALWPTFKAERRLSDCCRIRAERDLRRHKYDSCLSRDVDTWDYQWSFAILRNGGVAIWPAQNLIVNIGEEGTHTSANRLGHMGRSVDEEFRIQRHPRFVLADESFDAYHFRRHVRGSIRDRLGRRVSEIRKRWDG